MRALRQGDVAPGQLTRWRVAAATSHPIQYQAPWFRALAEAVDLEVFFCHQQDGEGQAAAGYAQPFEWDVPLLEGYRHRWLENRSARPNVSSFFGCDTPGIAAALAGGQFDACIVNGWYLKSYLQAIHACRRLRIPVLVRGDSQLGTARSMLKSSLKWLPYRVLLNRVDGHLFVGRANKAYLKHYGVADRKLFFVPHFVDNEFFADRAGRARQDGTARDIRRRFRIGGDETVAMFVGRFVQMKRPLDFVAALAEVKSRVGPQICGLMVGSGPLEAEARALASNLGAPVQFAGFCNQSSLPAYYAAADVLVLPSNGGETWGLVVNEAMACGLPAVVSDAVGCAPDLVEDSVTGYTFPLGSVPLLAERLIRIHGDSLTRRSELARSVRSRIAGYSCAAGVDGTLAALNAVCRPRAAGIAASRRTRTA